MIRKIFTLLALLVGVSTGAWAQTTQSVSRAMALTITPFLNCVGTKDIDYGPHRVSDGTIFTSATNYAEVQCTTDRDNSLNITFGLPSVMTNAAATGFPIPITYGNLSAFASDNSTQFDPAVGLGSDITPSGSVGIRLGWPRQGIGPSELVAVNVTTAKRGTYAAVVVFNVSVN